MPEETQNLLAQQKILISPLELLTAAAAVLLIVKEGKQHSCRHLCLLCDNTSACDAANTEVVYSALMRFSVCIFVQLCDEYVFTVQLLYIPSTENIILDAVSIGA